MRAGRERAWVWASQTAAARPGERSRRTPRIWTIRRRRGRPSTEALRRRSTPPPPPSSRREVAREAPGRRTPRVSPRVFELERGHDDFGRVHPLFPRRLLHELFVHVRRGDDVGAIELVEKSGERDGTSRASRFISSALVAATDRSPPTLVGVFRPLRGPAPAGSPRPLEETPLAALPLLWDFSIPCGADLDNPDRRIASFAIPDCFAVGLSRFGTSPRRHIPSPWEWTSATARSFARCSRDCGRRRRSS